MDITSYIALNGLVCLTTALVNIFFCFCLLCPGDQNETPKQPLKILLISLVMSNFCLEIPIFVLMFTYFLPQFFRYGFLVVPVTSHIAYGSMSSSLWLSIFYYTRIVPAQQAFFIWVKRNIKTVIYCGLAVDTSLILVEFALFLPLTFHPRSDCCTGNQNLTSEVVVDTVILLSIEILDTLYLFSFIVPMAFSWSSTLVYLCRHMKRMERSNSPFSSSRLRSQLRVSIMGIVQTALSVIHVCWSYLYGFFLIQYDQNNLVFETYYSFFSFGTTVTLGLSQSVLRRRTANLFNEVHQTVGKLRPAQR